MSKLENSIDRAHALRAVFTKGLESMEDWKKRLVEEYNQLKERYEELRAFNNKCEVKSYLEDLNEPHTPEEKRAARKKYHVTELLRAQQRTMEKYLHLLELRAELEGIDLVSSF